MPGIRFIALIFLVSFFPSSRFASADSEVSDSAAFLNKKMKTDVVLYARPILLRSFDAETAVDVLEKSPDKMGSKWKILVFRIDRVIRGEFKTLKGNKDLSMVEQAGDAIREKDFLKLLTMDFEKPEEKAQQKKCFSMAVSDPFILLGIKEGENIPKKRYKISLALAQKNPESYLMTGLEQT